MNITLAMAEQVSGFCVSLLTMFFTKKPLFQDTTVVLIIRIFFILVTLMQILVFLFIRNKITKVNNQTRFKYKNQGPLQDEEIESSVYEYDMIECNKFIRSLLLHSILSGFLHFKWGSIQPILILVLNGLRPFFFSSLVREYIYGQKVLRPFEKNYLFTEKEEEDVVEIKEEVKKKKKEE